MGVFELYSLSFTIGETYGAIRPPLFTEAQAHRAKLYKFNLEPYKVWQIVGKLPV